MTEFAHQQRFAWVAKLFPRTTVLIDRVLDTLTSGKHDIKTIS